MNSIDNFNVKDIEISFCIKCLYSIERSLNIARYKFSAIEMIRNNMLNNDAHIVRQGEEKVELRLVMNEYGNKQKIRRRNEPFNEYLRGKDYSDSIPEACTSFVERTQYQESTLKSSISTYNEFLKIYCDEDRPMEYHLYTTGKLIDSPSGFLVSFDESSVFGLTNSKIYLNITDKNVTMYKCTENIFWPPEGDQFVFEEGHTFNTELHYDDAFAMDRKVESVLVTTEKYSFSKESDDICFQVGFRSEKDSIVVDRNEYTFRISPCICNVNRQYDN